MEAGLRSPLFYAILTLYLLAGVLFATLTPNWQAPDEPAHYNYVRYLATQGGFPELTQRCYDQAYLELLKSRQFPPNLPLDTVCYEFHQPPLYYLLATPIFILSQGSLLALRLLSVVLGAGVVALAYVIARTIFPEWATLAYGTMAFVAFVPMHVAMLASANNDALAELLLAALLLLLVRRLLATTQATIQNNVVLGLLLGLGLITKATVYIAIPLIAVGLWLVSIDEARNRKSSSAGVQESEGVNQVQVRSESCQSWLPLSRVDWPLLAKQSLLIYGLALLIALPWYGRNAGLYGDFDLLGMARHNAVVVGQLRTADFLAEVGRRAYLNDFITTTFHSFWGQFGWMAVPMSERVYLALTLLTLAAVGGLVGYGLRTMGYGMWAMRDGMREVEDGKDAVTYYVLRIRQRQAMALMALTIVLMGLGYLWYNLEFVQFQGRYLFPALIPLGLVFSLGLHEALLPRRAWWLAGGLALVLGWLLITSMPGGDLDKWAVLLIALLLAFAAARAWLASRWPIGASPLLALCYAGLALLTLVSPFWYVVPYLSP